MRVLPHGHKHKADVDTLDHVGLMHVRAVDITMKSNLLRPLRTLPESSNSIG